MPLTHLSQRWGTPETMSLPISVGLVHDLISGMPSIHSESAAIYAQAYFYVDHLIICDAPYEAEAYNLIAPASSTEAPGVYARFAAAQGTGRDPRDRWGSVYTLKWNDLVNGRKVAANDACPLFAPSKTQ